MIHVVRQANQHLYARQLERMFAMRGAADEFDDADAVYLLALDVFADITAAVRLSASLGGGAAEWALSHWVARDPAAPQPELMIGVLEFCQLIGLARLTFLGATRVADHLTAEGWPLRRLGDGRTTAGGAVIAEVDVAPHLLVAMRSRTGLLAPRLIEIPPGNLRVPDSIPPELQAVAAEIGAGPLRRLVRSLAAALPGASDAPRAAELVAAISLLVEAAGIAVEGAEDAIASTASVT